MASKSKSSPQRSSSKKDDHKKKSKSDDKKHNKKKDDTKDKTTKHSKRPAVDPAKKSDMNKKPRTESSSHSNSSNNNNNNKNVSASAMRQRRHADIVEEGKAIWNKLRLKTNTAEENRQLMDQLIPLIKGKANEIALQHDASRVIQAAIQFGTAAERLDILKEICNSTTAGSSANPMVELAKSQYANFVVLKFIKYCHTDETCVALLVKAFKGHVPKLAVHAVGSRVIEALFTTLTPKQTAILKQEFYGPHFSLFANDTLQQQDAVVPTIQSNLAVAPEKKDQTMEYMKNLVHKGMEKSLYGHTFFQELFAEYLSVAKPKEIQEIAAIAADQVIHLLSTRAGTRAAAVLVSYATAKERKRMMKSLKGYTRSGLLHHDAYLAILRLVQLTDDTVSIQKNILNEILTAPTTKDAAAAADKENNSKRSSLLEIALSGTASKLFLMLLADGDAWKKFFDPYEHSVLFPNPMVEENGKQVPTSKKEDSQRRKELAKHLKEPLIELCTNHAEELLRSISGSLVLREVYTAFYPEQLVTAVINACRTSLNKSDNSNSKDSPLSLFEDVTGHFALKHLILSDAASSQQDLDQDKMFASQFMTAFGSQLIDICKSNRGSFVVAALCKVPWIGATAIKKQLDLQELKKKLKDGGSTAGYEALLKELK